MVGPPISSTATPAAKIQRSAQDTLCFSFTPCKSVRALQRPAFAPQLDSSSNRIVAALD